MAEVVYLTGAPASGKSSLTTSLLKDIPGLKVFAFGERLTARLRTAASVGSQAELRTRSAQAVTPDDVRAVDEDLIAFVAANRAVAPVIIDSHAVTKESYGFRVTPYMLKDFERLRPTQIWVLYTAPEIAVARIGSDAQGRPAITAEEARFHTHLQASVAVSYSMHLGIPVHFFDAQVPLADLAGPLVERLTRT
jgi:adenylate kinase